VKTRKTRPLAALAMLALIGAGCSDAPADKGNGANTIVTHRDKGVKFAECMRDHGVKGFPDPDASGELTIDGVLNGSSLDPSSPVWKTAVGACKDLQPPGFTGGGDRTAEEQEAALEFAQCMRDNGVKDFPDPADGEPLVNTYKIPSSSQPGGMTILNAAMQKCRDAAAEAVRGEK
jgi:hypothetical protein